MYVARYSFFGEGAVSFLRPAAEAQGEVAEPFFEQPGWTYERQYFKNLPALHRDEAARAWGGLEVFGVVGTFLVSCFAKKIFDEVYERTLKRPIAAQLDRLFSKVEVPTTKFVEFRDVIYLEDIDLVVVIRGRVTEGDTLALQNQVLMAHRVAHKYIEQHGKKAPIHCHKIDDESVALEPELFSTLEEIKTRDRAQAKLPGRSATK